MPACLGKRFEKSSAVVLVTLRLVRISQRSFNGRLVNIYYHAQDANALIVKENAS